MIKKKGPGEQSDRIESLQGLRALAFLGIFLSHCNATKTGPWGVSIFFCLSGFLMVFRYKGKRLGVSLHDSICFSVERIRKLYCLYCITMIAILIDNALFHAALSEQNLPKTMVQIFLNAFMLQSWVPHSDFYFSMNAVSWYLSSLAFIYVAFPLILSCINRLNSLMKSFLCLAGVFALHTVVILAVRDITVKQTISDNFTKWVVYICPAFRLGDFIMGGLLGNIFLLRRETRSAEARPNTARTTCLYTSVELLIIALNVIVLLAYSQKLAGVSIPKGFRLNTIFLPCSLLLIYVFACGAGLISRLLSTKTLVYIGNISACGFLIHKVSLRYLDVITKQYLGVALKPWPKAVIALALTVFLSEMYIVLLKERKPARG